MNEFDDILNAEKQRQHRLDDPDLMAFAVMTQIAHEEAQARIKRRFRISLILSVIAAFAVIQMLALSAFSFSGFIGGVGRFIENYPYAISIANLGLVSMLILARKFRII